MTTWGASNTTTVTHSTNASWATVVTYTFAAADQVAGATYAVFWNAAAFGGSTSSDYLLRATQGGAATASVNIESRVSASPSDRDQQGGFFFFTAAGTPADTTFAIELQSESTNTSSAYNGYLRIVKLPAGSVWSEATAEQFLTSSATFTDVTGSGISISGDHVLLCSAEARSGNLTTYGVEVGINVDGSVSNSLIGGNSDNNTYFNTMVIARATASAAAKVQFRQTVAGGGSVFVRNTRLLALPVSAFRNVFTSILGADSAGTETTYTTALTTTQTVSAGDHLLIGSMGLHAGSTTDSAYAQIASGGAQVDEFVRASASSTSPLGSPTGSITRLETYTAGSRAWTIDRKSESTNTARILAGSAIAVLDLDDGAGGGGGGISGTASGSLDLTGTATGTSPRNASASGTLDLTGAATGGVHNAGTASGTIDLTGTATGSGQVSTSGTASGNIDLTGTGAGTNRVAGAASGGISLAGASMATNPVKATGSGEIALSGAAAGTVAVSGAASGSLDLTGAVSVSGAATGSFAITGIATGIVRGWGILAPPAANWNEVAPAAGTWTTVPPATGTWG